MRPNPPVMTILQTRVEKISFLRLKMSAKAPAGRASKAIGNAAAVWIMATMNGVGAREIISHAAPTSCIHTPIIEKEFAAHSIR